VTADSWSVPDFTVPSATRMYDYFLGGKDHFEADRKAAEQVIAAYPETRTVARANRRFLTRAVWYLAEHGITQYVDLGSGMPTSPAVHEIARQVRPGARVAYVDNDPVVASHCRAICDSDDGLQFIDGDIREPQGILNDLQLARTIDLSEPVAFLCAAVLHFVPDDDQPKGIVAALRWRMAPGSYLLISHGAADAASKDVLSEIADVYQTATAPAVPRTAKEIRELFTGLDLVEPGLVDARCWRSDMREKATKIRLLAGVGRKPSNLPGAPAERSPVYSKGTLTTNPRSERDRG
jgi:SAM-dependent methyltransferase